MPITFAFDSQTWLTCIAEVITLRKVFRQADPGKHILMKLEDPNRLFVVFADFLNQMRFGTISPRARALFTSLEREVEYSDGVEPVHLYGPPRPLGRISTYCIQLQVCPESASRVCKLGPIVGTTR